MAEENRRSFLKWAIHGLIALFTLVLGLPIVAYIIDARNRGARQGGFRPVDGIDLGELAAGQVKQGVIRDVRRDAWTLHPSDVVGRVWVVKHGQQANEIDVFTTVCPHLGCSINLTTEGAQATGFLCPCHNGQFDLEGALARGPAPRGMDRLEWQLDPANNNRLLVNYVNFKQLEATPIPRT